MNIAQQAAVSFKSPREQSIVRGLDSRRSKDCHRHSQSAGVNCTMRLCPKFSSTWAIHIMTTNLFTASVGNEWSLSHLLAFGVNSSLANYDTFHRPWNVPRIVDCALLCPYYASSLLILLPTVMIWWWRLSLLLPDHNPPPVIPPSLRKGIHMTYDIPHYSYVHSTPNITTTLIPHVNM